MSPFISILILIVCYSSTVPVINGNPVQESPETPELISTNRRLSKQPIVPAENPEPARRPIAPKDPIAHENSESIPTIRRPVKEPIPLEHSEPIPSLRRPAKEPVPLEHSEPISSIRRPAKEPIPLEHSEPIPSIRRPAKEPVPLESSEVIPAVRRPVKEPIPLEPSEAIPSFRRPLKEPVAIEIPAPIPSVRRPAKEPIAVDRFRFPDLRTPVKEEKEEEEDEDEPRPPFLRRVPIGLRFFCRNKPHGYYADPDAGCQVYHQCTMDGQRYSFLCGLGTVFNQISLVCDFPDNYNCNDAHADAPEANARAFPTEQPEAYVFVPEDAN